jgi:hypothetical protein
MFCCGGGDTWWWLDGYAMLCGASSSFAAAAGYDLTTKIESTVPSNDTIIGWAKDLLNMTSPNATAAV